MNISRREFLAGISGLAATSAVARPIRDGLSPKLWLDELLAPPTAKDYIQDGLVCMWDAIENGGPGVHDPTLNKNTWVEWCGTGWVMDIDRGGFFEDDWFGQTSEVQQFNRGASQGLYDLICSTYYTRETYVGEVYNTPETNKEEYLSGTYGTPTSSGYLRNQVMYSTGTHRVGNNEALTSVMVSPESSLTIVQLCDKKSEQERCYCRENGILVADKTRFYDANFKPHYFYCQPFAHKFHCMRLYNRILSEKELAYNLLVDRHRFNIP